jgi:hypothetical protein
MADFAGTISSIGSGAGTTFTWIIYIVVAIVLILLIGGGIFLYWWTRKRYNLRVEIKMTRSDGKITIGEWGKGQFNAKRGVLYIKRPKLSPIPIKVIDIRRYLQGSDLLTVMQVGPEDYRPVLNDSWTEHIVEYEDEKGNVIEQKESVLNIKVDSGVNKAWRSAFESASKKAYSLASFLQQYATPISIAIVIIALFVGFAIIWTRLPTICH